MLLIPGISCDYSTRPLNKQCPEIRGQVILPCSSQNDGPRTREIIKNIIVEKPQLLSECMLECDNGKCFRNNSMPLLLSLNPQPFLNFACDLVNSFHVSQREVQSTLRNQLGKSLSEVLGVNIIPSKRDILHELKVQKED